MQKIKKYLTFFIVFVISLTISHVLITEVFVDNSPLIRSDLGSYIVMKIKSGGFELAALNPFQSNRPRRQSDEEALKNSSETQARLAGIPLQTIARGVEAKSNGELSMRIINTGAVDKVTYEFTLRDGRKIRVSIMKELIDKYGLKQEDIEKMVNQ